MMKKNLVPLLAIAFVVAIISTGLFYGFFVSKLQNSKNDSGPQVVVAARRVDRGAVLKTADLKMVSWPVDANLDGAYQKTAELEGMTAVESLEPNEPVLKPKVASSTGGGGLPIPAGMRAVTTHIPDSDGVLELLRPGHRVDVQMISPATTAPELKTILQNIEVLTIIDRKELRLSSVVTLLVTPDQADALSLADATARVRLVLRNPVDEEMRALPRLTLPPLFQSTQTGKTAVAKRP